MKHLLLSLAAMAAVFTACEKSDDLTDPTKPSVTANAHLDVWLAAEGTTASGNYVASVMDPTNSNQTVNVLNSGTEVTGKLTYGAIVKGKYYYSTTPAFDGVAKYQIINNQVVTVAEVPFLKNTFPKGGMTGNVTAAHEWIGDNTLMLLAYQKTTKKHIWSKYDVTGMTVLSEGEFDLHKALTDAGLEDAVKFSTAGHIRYRKSDGKIILFTSIHYKGVGNHPMTGAPNTKRGPLAVVILDEKTMEVVAVTADTRVSGLALESYGDTQQEKAYFDHNGDLYLIALEAGSTYSPGGPIPECVMVRVKNGANETDKGYLFTPAKDTNILVVKYLSPGKALLFVGDHERYGYTPGGAGSFGSWNNYAYYYAIFDSNAKTLTKVQYEGKDLDWSTGNFNNYIAQAGDKIYFGLNTDTGETFTGENSWGEYTANYSQAQVYILDTKTLDVSKGFEVDAKFTFLRMYGIEN